MNFRRISYRHSFLAGWYMLWRSVVVGVLPGILLGLALIWLNGFLASGAIGYLRNFPTTKEKGELWKVCVSAILMYHIFRETWDEARRGTATYLITTSMAACIALLASSVLTSIASPESEVAALIAPFYVGLGPALGILGGLTLFANGLVNKEFASFRFIVLKRAKDGDERVPRLSETERLRVAWFLLWRGIGMGVLVDLGLVVAITVLLYPFSDTATARAAAFYLGKGAASSGLLLSTLFIGFPLAIPQLIQKTFRTEGATFAFKVVRLKPIHYQGVEEPSGRDAQVSS